jgi:hypothetical protein
MFRDYSFCRLSPADSIVPVSVALTVHIANRRNLYAFVPKEIFQIIDTLVPRTDTAHSNPVARGNIACFTQR